MKSFQEYLQIITESEDYKFGDSKKNIIKFLNKNYEAFKRGDTVEINYLDLKLDQKIFERYDVSTFVLRFVQKWGEKKFPNIRFNIDESDDDNVVKVSFLGGPVYTSWMDKEFLEAGISSGDVKKIMKKINNYKDDDYEFRDNERIHITKDIYGSKEKYDSDHNNGCCGFVDDEFKVGDYNIKFGFNYGH